MKKFKTILREKGFLILMLTAVVAVTAIAAFSITNEKTENPNNLYVDLEDSTGTTIPNVPETTSFESPFHVDNAEVTFPGDAALIDSETTMDLSNLMDATDEPRDYLVDGGETGGGTTDDAQGQSVDGSGPQDLEQVAGPVLNLAFTADSTLNWPVEGNVILDFSMDGTVFFPTLEQYKYNPAILIQSEVNTPVLASTGGIVMEVGSNEEIGEYVLMEIGSEYTLMYGQLKAVSVEAGQSVEVGQVIGFVSEPTKYYVVEGSNLYLKMMKGEEPIDPLDYIR